MLADLMWMAYLILIVVMVGGALWNLWDASGPK